MQVIFIQKNDIYLPYILKSSNLSKYFKINTFKRRANESHIWFKKNITNSYVIKTIIENP